MLGKKVRVIVEDDQGKPEEAATAVTKLINQDHVVAILGEVASSRSLAAAPIAQANKVPMISPVVDQPAGHRRSATTSSASASSTRSRAR